jgi:hypothetical protein
MARFTLSPYVIKVKERRDLNYFDLDNLPNHDDLWTLFSTYLRRLQNRYLRDDDEAEAPSKILRLTRLDCEGREIAGIVETGEAGLQADLYDIDAEEVEFTREPRHAEMYPFYFLIRIPRNSPRGIVILQRFQNYGIRTQLFSGFAEFLKDTNDRAIFEMNPLTETEALRQFMRNGRLTEIKAIQYEIPADRADAFGIGVQEHPIRMSFVLNPHRTGSLPFVGRISDLLESRRSVNELVELPGFQPDTVKVKFTMDGAERTFDLTNIGKARPFYDVSGDVVLGPNRFPEFDSINDIAHQHMDRFLDIARVSDE